MRSRLDNNENEPGNNLQREDPPDDSARSFQIVVLLRNGRVVVVLDILHLEANVQTESRERDDRHQAKNDPVDDRDDGVRLARIGKAIQNAVDEVVENEEDETASGQVEELVQHQVDNIVHLDSGIGEEKDLIHQDCDHRSN